MEVGGKENLWGKGNKRLVLWTDLDVWDPQQGSTRDERRGLTPVGTSVEIGIGKGVRYIVR